MYVIDQSTPEATPIEGLAHATWAGASDGLTQLSVWRQTLAPGAATPPHSHSCDEVVLCHAGAGELHIDGQVQRFGAGQSVVLPREKLHQLFSVGSTPLELTGIFGQTPVPVRLPDGQALDLPWRS